MRILSILAIVCLFLVAGCGEKANQEKITGNAVVDVEEKQSKIVISEYAQRNKDKKEMCDKSYDGPSIKICYKLFGIKQVIGGSIN